MAKLLFAGTPITAVAPLRRLVADGHHIAAVLTRPDAPLGRKRVMTPSPVAAAADELGIPTIKASRIDEETHARIVEADVDLAVVVAYGGLIPSKTLAVPTHGWINLHFSDLPQLRGAAPVQWALINGEASTGATVFVLEAGLDTGPVIARMHTDIAATETAGSLLERLSVEGSALLSDAVAGLLDGTMVPQEQVGQATYAPKLSREDGRIDFRLPADVVHARIAGVTPEPGAFTALGEATLKLDRVDVVTEVNDLEAGKVRVESGKRGRVLVGTGSHAVALTRVQPAGKKLMAATDWARGIDTEGTVLG